MPVHARTREPTAPPGLAAGALTIGEAAAASGVSAKMIRYYESIGLVAPAERTRSNYRIYDETALQRLRFVARARELGFSIDEIQRLLGLWLDPRHTSAKVKTIALRHVAELSRRIATLQSLKGALEHLAARCHGDSRPDCPILDDLAGTPRASETISLEKHPPQSRKRRET